MKDDLWARVRGSLLEATLYRYKRYIYHSRQKSASNAQILRSSKMIVNSINRVLVAKFCSTSRLFTFHSAARFVPNESLNRDNWTDLVGRSIS